MPGILIVTQGGIGRALVAGARRVLGKLPLAVKAVGVAHSESRAELTARIEQAARELQNSEGGVLIACDLFGATPANVAREIGARIGAPCVCGVNLPMLLELLTAQSNSAHELTLRAADAARAAIVAPAPSPTPPRPARPKRK